jgi:hypothetical protein
MARLDPVHVKLHVDASEFVHALDVIRAGLSLTTRRVVEVLAREPRLTAPRLAAVLWPGKDPEPRKSIAEWRLRGAAKAGLAHVAFEPHAWTKDHIGWSEIRPTYEVSALGRTLIKPMRVEVR